MSDQGLDGDLERRLEGELDELWSELGFAESAESPEEIVRLRAKLSEVLRLQAELDELKSELKFVESPEEIVRLRAKLSEVRELADPHHPPPSTEWRERRDRAFAATQAAAEAKGLAHKAKEAEFIAKYPQFTPRCITCNRTREEHEDLCFYLPASREVIEAYPGFARRCGKCGKTRKSHLPFCSYQNMHLCDEFLLLRLLTDAEKRAAQAGADSGYDHIDLPPDFWEWTNFD